MKTLISSLFLYMLVVATSGLYEDQVGKFEWRKQYVGKAVLSEIDLSSPIKKVILATDKNVVAALSLKTGSVLWRHALERGPEGAIKFLIVDKEIVTVSGSRTPVVRGWDLDSGHELFEWAPEPMPMSATPKWVVTKDYLVVFKFNHNGVTSQWYNYKTGRALGSKSVEIGDSPECVSQSGRILCLDKSRTLTVITPKDPEELELNEKDITSEVGEEGELSAVPGNQPLVSIRTGTNVKIIQISPEIKLLPISTSSGIYVSATSTEDQSMIILSEVKNSVLSVRTYTFDGEEVASLRGNTPYPENVAEPESVSAVCQQRRDFSIACRLLISGKDDSVSLVQHPGPFLWTREEALASIISVEIVELPVSDIDAAIEKEFGSKTHGFLGLIGRRLVTQWLQLQTLLLTILGVTSDSSRGSSALVRDDFGLHKLIVAVTAPGKVFGIDNLSGDIVWQIIADMRPLSAVGTPTFPTFYMRSPIHVPHPSQMAILGRTTSGDGVLLVINPITGTLVEPLIKLGYRVRQVTQIPATTDDFIRGILLLDDKHRLHAYPTSTKNVARETSSKTFLFTVEPSGLVEGFSVRVSDGELVAVRTWQQKLGQDDAHVVAVAAKRDTERVHSQGRVLGDRSVLYKYVNPNLVAVFTQGYHPAHKTILNIYLLDAVSGMIVYSASHRKARDPIQAVHSENWLVYTYFSEKHRRTEVATLELYEGPVQSNETAFSSLATPPLIPIVEKQAYILPAYVSTIKDTVTVKGITNKDIMVGLSSGSILELPWAYLDPRRTIMVTPEMREEGVIPYIPELPIPFEAIVNHNQSVLAVRGIHTAPSGIESTCLIFVYGLDIYYTRVAPSKTFDLLKEDFDYVLISAVLAALIIASVITRRIAARKALKLAWK